MGQQTLIFIDDTEKTDANITAKSFAHKDTRYRTYYNTIGASLVAKYLSSEGIDVKDCTGLHSIKKVLEEFDVSDIILPNIRMDVRVIFDENKIFIPKSHFQYGVVPDIYVVVKPSEDLSNVEIIGFFEPGLINKKCANNDYYFIEKEKLTSGENLIEYIHTHSNNTFRKLSDEELETFEQIIMEFSDNDIEESEKKFLIQQLTTSSELREKFIEYENFEKLSYKAMTDPMIDVPELPQDTVAVDEFEIFDAQPVEQTEPIVEEIQPTVEIEETEPIINTEETEIGEDTEPTEPVAEILNEEPTDNNILDEINIADENILENVSEISDLAGATAGFEAINKVSDTMESILFDNETVEAVNNIENIDNAEISEQQEPIVEPIIENIEPQEEIAEPVNDTGLQEEIIEPIVENIEPQEEIIPENNDMLSFEDVIVPENLEQTEVIEETTDENKLSFDTIEAPELNIAEENISQDKNMLSFEDVVVPENLEQPQETEQSDNKLSFETIEVPEVEVSAEEEQKTDNTLSFDDVIVPEMETEEETSVNDNLLSFNDIQTPEMEEINNVENEQIPDEIPQNSEELQNTEMIDMTKLEIIDNSAEVQEENTAEQETLENFKPIETSDNVSEPINEYGNESFGKNLLENLNEESFDNISIESTDSSEENVEETVSDSVLSQIDDVLDASQTKDVSENIEDENKLDVLYTEENTQNANMEDISQLEDEKEETEQQVPGSALYKKQSTQNKKTLVTAAILVAIIAGLSASVFLKPKNNETASIEQPVNNETTVQNTETPEQTDNILEANAPQEIKTEQTQQVNKSTVQEMKNTSIKPNKSTASMSVTKIVWDVPGIISTNQRMQNFLKTVGKSVKLSLSTDLLLVSEYAYTNSVKVSITINSDGSVGSAKIASSSGSTEIDNIVLRSVNDTLNVIKPPSDTLQGQPMQLTLIIYF